MGRAIIGVLRLRQLQLGRHPDYLVIANRCTDSSLNTEAQQKLRTVEFFTPSVLSLARGRRSSAWSDRLNLSLRSLPFAEQVRLPEVAHLLALCLPSSALSQPMHDKRQSKHRRQSLFCSYSADYKGFPGSMSDFVERLNATREESTD